MSAERAGGAQAPGPRRKRRGRREGEKPTRPEPVGTLVSSVLERIGIRERVERAGTAARWADVVGPRIARVTRAARVRERTLFVEVESAAWMTELDMMKRSLLRRLNEGRERGEIDRIVFVQGGGAPRDRRSTRGGRTGWPGRSPGEGQERG